jgi:hypothetical protein
MLTFILRWRGWDVVNLGANVPFDHLDDTLRSTSPQLVLSTAQTLPGAASLNELAGYMNAQAIPLAYGGGIFNHIPALTERIHGYYLGDELGAAPQVLEGLLSHQPALPSLSSLTPDYTTALAGFQEKEALIVTSVKTTMNDSEIVPQYLEIANVNLARNILSALALGEINFLDYTVGWLNGLLENYGLSPALAAQYYSAYRHAVQQYLGSQAGPILDWLDRVVRNMA